MKSIFIIPLLLLIFVNTYSQTAIGEWLFNNTNNLTEATIGTDLTLIGSHESVNGPSQVNGAARIGVGSYYELNHGLTPNGTESLINEYSLLLDIKIEDIDHWRALLQTDETNSNDAEMFIRNLDGALGLSSTGYSSITITPNIWSRIVIVVNNGTEYSIYLNGEKVLDGVVQNIDSNFGLSNTMLLFADNDEEDYTIDIARISLYDYALNSSEVQNLGPVVPMPAPIGEWLFNNNLNLSQATIGPDLILSGSDESVDGITPNNKASRITTGSYYKLIHGISNESDTYVNKYSIIFDFKISDLESWHSFLQTDGGNTTDADLFIKPNEGTIGTGETGYSIANIETNMWYRLIMVVDNGSEYKLYLDGEIILDAPIQDIDGRFALRDSILFFADDNNEDGNIDIARISLYNYPLNYSEIQKIGITPTPFLTKPYLQNATTSGITIMWETNTEVNGSISYSENEDYNNSVTSTYILTNANTFIHKAVLTNLNNTTQYNYIVNVDSFSLAPSRFYTNPISNNASFTVGLWSDSHYPQPFNKMVQYMFDSIRPNFACNSGDLAKLNGTTREDIKTSFLPCVCGKIGRKIPFYTAMGNHDVAFASDGELIRQFHDQPNEVNSDENNFNGSYLMMYSNVAFIFIDWNKMNTDLPLGNWLENTLALQQVQNARFRFILIHNAPFYERGQDFEQDVVKTNLPPLAEQYNVDVVFSGHIHTYERGFLNGVQYITMGGGSFIDFNEPMGNTYEHIIVGTNKPPENSANFHNGLRNHILSLNIEGNEANINVHFFDEEGNFEDVIETIYLSSDFTNIQTQEILEAKINYDIQANIIRINSQEDFIAKIYNISGQCIYTDTNYNNCKQITVSNFAKGIYVIKLENKQGIFSKKINIK